MEDLKFIKKKIEEGNFIILDESIAHGTVYKIHAIGDLEKDGLEVGYLYLTKGSSIKKHTHVNDIEMYQLIGGTLRINGIYTTKNICLLNKSHSIDKVPCNTIIKTYKINKLYLNKEKITETEAFDKVLKKTKNS